MTDDQMFQALGITVALCQQHATPEELTARAVLYEKIIRRLVEEVGPAPRPPTAG